MSATKKSGAVAGKSSQQLKRWRITPHHHIVKIDADLLLVVHNTLGVQHFITERVTADTGWTITSVRPPPTTDEGAYEFVGGIGNDTAAAADDDDADDDDYSAEEDIDEEDIDDDDDAPPV